MAEVREASSHASRGLHLCRVTPAYIPSTKASHMAKAEVEEQGSIAHLRWEEPQMRTTKGVDTGRDDKRANTSIYCSVRGTSASN